ncbi:MAG: Exodeoxyribonuclease 7 large subunit [Actinobacteria bacterium]|nr:Exodeoxyribonuclease 7 large subunit [Actinomycetota bacterium]
MEKGDRRGVLTVTELTARIKTCLEDGFRSIRVEGEVSNYKSYPSGHRYFSLKDEGAQVRVVLFRGRDRFIFGDVRDGQTVVVSGSLGGGIGSLFIELEKRKARLAAEGLFDPERKRPLPAFPVRIGIVTSRQGAALRDIIRVARGRWPAIGITLAPALVQGEGAAEDIAAALGALYMRGNAEVVIVGRGGGSVEDLWAFNEEVVVRAIAASPVPTVSAVGHETDFTLADLAADLRAPTPTAAAQMAVPDRVEMEERVSGLAFRAKRAERNIRETLRRELRIAAGAMADPRPHLQAYRYSLAKETDALAEGAQVILREGRNRLMATSHGLRLQSPSARVSNRRGEVAVLLARAGGLVSAAREEPRRKLGVFSGKLSALDPTSVLSRGYAIAMRRSSGAAVRSVTEIAQGDSLDVRVSDGTFGAVVEKDGA